MFDPAHAELVAGAARDSILPQQVAEAIAPLTWLAGGLYVLAVGLLALYGLHSLWLLALFLKHRKAAKAQADREAVTALPADADLPHVLVQLPVYNERDVVVRVLEAMGRLDWPKDRLHIQLLDDSTDDSVNIGRTECEKLRQRGFDAVSIHRVDRTGFKAGALENGMKHCDAPYIAIFDADFIPNPDFLRIAIKPLLADPGLALVQGRWEHCNRDDNILTKAQAVGIDGHFAVEQGARAWSGLPMNFNGTCGMWRRTAIVDAGGWEHDTLTEDMDLSYRAQLVGWRCTYRIGLGVPGEVPADVNAWRSQQFRWAKGSIQTAIKLLPRIWRSTWSLHAKLCSSLHMTHYMVHPLILLSLFCAPLALLLVEQGQIPIWVLMLGILSFVVGASAPIAVYVTSQLTLHGKAGWRNLRALPILCAIGTGIAISNGQAVWQAIRGKQSAFIRTPKAGSAGTSSYRANTHSGIPELLCALWAFVGITIGFIGSHTWVTPLLAIYLSGFAWMSWHCIAGRRARVRQVQQRPAEVVEPSEAAQPA
ncbi:MAG: glycosyltransferase [Planctomycetes bacterium]|nr:glycosyltransferase [Planctomycetota bacterium]